MKIYTFLVFIIFISLSAFGQQQVLTQTVRGVIVDKQTQYPLSGANIAVLNSSPQIGTTSDETGSFSLQNVPIGRQSILVSFIGYHTEGLNDIIVRSSRQSVLYIEMVQKVELTEEIKVIGNAGKGRAINTMAVVSARAFSPEESGRYAGSHDDIARMAMNFAGVSGANDQRNDIIIRGNTPSGILWQLDGVDVPNPNHFAATGTTGGPVSILNNNTLRNSDFFTGAYPAEYSNVFSGVFDLKMREGNNEKSEIMGQVGFNGIEVGLEGPFSKRGKSSYLINYRHSFLEIFEKVGFDVGTTSVPKYQDLTYKMSFPVKKGKIEFFGIGGKSHVGIMDSKIDEPSLYSLDGMDVYNGSEFWVSGLSHTFYKDEKTYIKSILSYVYQNPFTYYNTILADNTIVPRFREDNKEMKLSMKFIFNKKYNSQLAIRLGATIDVLGYEMDTREYIRSDESWRQLIFQKKSIGNGTYLTRTFGQVSYKFNEKFEIKPGVNLMYLGLNGTYSFEPRIGFNWNLSKRSNLSFGIGKHAKMLSLATYFYESYSNSAPPELTNFNLDFVKTIHYVIGYNRMLGDNLRFKTELYYQHLYSVPVGKTSSTYSYLNEGAQWGLNTRAKLVSEGTGQNYGVEFTLEKFFHKNYYFLLTSSLFEAKYKGSDNVLRNSGFNGNFVNNALIGVEFNLPRNATLFFDVKSTLAGGRRYTPINIEASREKGGALETVYYQDRAFEEQFANYFKTDVKLGFRFNGRKYSQIIEFSAENVTNHINPYFHSFSKTRDEIVYTQQMGFFPLAKYRIYF